MLPSSLSRSIEDYLKAIYDLSREEDPASTSAIAEALDIQPASVTGMVKRLAEMGLLEHLPYKGVRLTKAGHREALRVVRRHRIIEAYLCERLGYPWDDVHAEAERLEHAASDDLVERMAHALDYPSHDPHGAPIPTITGDIDLRNFSTLANATSGTKLRIQSVPDEEEEELISMAADGLLPGVEIRVKKGADTEGGAVAIVLEDSQGRSLTVKTELARRIYVALQEE